MGPINPHTLWPQAVDRFSQRAGQKDFLGNAIDRSWNPRSLPAGLRALFLVIENAQVPCNHRVSQHRPVRNHDYRPFVSDNDHSSLASCQKGEGPAAKKRRAVQRAE